MDCIKSCNRIQSSKNAFCSHVAMVLLLSFAICVPVAVGSGHERHFELRGRGLLAVEALTPPPGSAAAPEDSALPIGPPPSLVSPSPPVPSPTPKSPPSPPPSLSPPPLPSPPPFSFLPPPSPPLESPLPPELPPVEPPPPPPPPTIVNPADTWNESEKAGVVIAAIAALLQVSVVAFLLIKRHQMLTTVEYEDFDDEYDNPDPGYRHPESA